MRDDRRTLLIDDLPCQVPSGAVARSPSPRRWVVEPMDGGPALVALPGSRVPDLVLSPEVRGFYEVYVGLCSLDGQPSEVEARVGDTSARLRLEGGEVDCREVAFGRMEMTGRQVALRHPAGARSCVTHVKLVPILDTPHHTVSAAHAADRLSERSESRQRIARSSAARGLARRNLNVQ